MYVCLYVCTWGYIQYSSRQSRGMRVCMYVYMCVSVDIWNTVLDSREVYVYMCMHIYVCTCVCIYMCAVRVDTYICVYVWIHVIKF